MKTPIPTAAALLFLVLAAAGCSNPDSRRGEEEGLRSAEAILDGEVPHLLYIGLPSSDASPLDPETGLLRYSLGCVVSDESVARMGAHNGAVLAALRDGRLEGRTFKDRVLEAAEARAFFADGGGAPLLLDGEAVASPAGGFRAALAPRFGKPGDTPYVFVLDGEGKRRELTYVGGPRARAAFAHGGRTLLVRDDVYNVIRTFDLARALELQVFSQ